MNDLRVWFRFTSGGFRNALHSGIINAPKVTMEALVFLLTCHPMERSSDGLGSRVTRINANPVCWLKPYISQQEVDKREI